MPTGTGRQASEWRRNQVDNVSADWRRLRL